MKDTDKNEKYEITEGLCVLGEYNFCTNYNGELWMHGPHGDGMQLGPIEKDALQKLLEEFFKKWM